MLSVCPLCHVHDTAKTKLSISPCIPTTSLDGILNGRKDSTSLGRKKIYTYVHNSMIHLK
jgi:hypothetical protein